MATKTKEKKPVVRSFQVSFPMPEGKKVDQVTQLIKTALQQSTDLFSIEFPEIKVKSLPVQKK